MALNVGELVAYLRMDSSQFSRTADQSESRFSRLGSSLVTAAKLVGAAGVGAIGAAGAVGIRTAAQMEQASIGFTTMLGSAQKAQAFLGDLSAFAAKTPFEFPELQTAASSLVSAGVEASKVIPIMTSLGNATSGMGTGSEGVKRATVALQQMNAAGKITGEDLNQLRDAGIPVYDLLAAATGKSKEAVTELAAKGKLGRQELEQLMSALESGKGLERFTGLMEAQSQSLTGLWSTLKDTFSQGMSTAIQPLIPMIKEGLGGAIAFTADMMPRVATGLQSLVGGIAAFAAGLRTSESEAEHFGAPLEGMALWGARAKAAFDSVRSAVVGMFPTDGAGAPDFGAGLQRVADAATQLWPSIKSAAENMSGLGPVVTIAGAAFGFLASHLDTVVQYMPLIIAAFVAYKTAQAASTLADIAALPITALLAASNFAHASAIWALLAAMGYERTSRLASITAWIASAAATVANTVAIAALTVASWALTAVEKAITAGQWLWNAALSANPIGLVIIAVAAFAAGMIYLYNHSETARNIVTGAFDAVGKAASFMWNDVIKPAFAFLAEAWFTVVGGIVNGAATAFGWVPGIGGKLKDAAATFNTFRDDVMGSLNGISDKTVNVTANARANFDASLGQYGGNRITERADGGIVPRYADGGLIGGVGGPRQDNVMGLDRATGRQTTWVSPNEYVVNAASTAKHRGLIEAINADKLADGGLVVRGSADAGPITRGLSTFYDGTLGAVTALAQKQADEMLGRTLAAAATADAGGGSGVAGQGSDAIKAFIRSSDPLPYVWGAVGPRAYDCSGLVGEVLNRMTGRRSYSRAFTTSSIGAGQYGLKPGLGGMLDIGVTAGTGHMAGSYGGLGFEARSTKTGIFTGAAAKSPGSFARKFHLADGGFVDMLGRAMDVAGDPGNLTVDDRPAREALPWGVFDRGGWLEPGAVAANRGTGRELVHPAKESAEIVELLRESRGNRGPTLHIDTVYARDDRDVAAAGMRALEDALAVYRV